MKKNDLCKKSGNQIRDKNEKNTEKDFQLK